MLDVFTYGLENMKLPYPAWDWDSQPGSVLQHRRITHIRVGLN